VATPIHRDRDVLQIRSIFDARPSFLLHTPTAGTDLTTEAASLSMRTIDITILHLQYSDSCDRYQRVYLSHLVQLVELRFLDKVRCVAIPKYSNSSIKDRCMRWADLIRSSREFLSLMSPTTDRLPGPYDIYPVAVHGFSALIVRTVPIICGETWESLT
jgi:hypothetical protein